MAKTQSLLVRLLKTPHIERVVPHLQPDVLHRVIQHCGLEDSAEIVALATPHQLERILDVDIWRAPAPGREEVFDADRFGLWLEVLMQSGADVAAAKVVAIDDALVVAGLSRHLTVFDLATAAPYTTLEGEQAGGRSARGVAAEIGGYFIEARCESAWDAIVDLLLCLSADHRVHFERLMRACVRLSDSAREADGFHGLLDDREQEAFDLATAREARRDTQGYATPAQARAFLQAARHLSLTLDRPPIDPVSRAYFHAMTAAEARGTEVMHERSDAVQDRDAAASRTLDADAMAAAFDVLRDAGVVPPPRGLLPARANEAARLTLLRAHLESHDRGTDELAYLANTLLAGGAVQGRAFTPEEASEAAAATCNLGLQNWPAHWQGQDLVTAFRVGCRVLHRDVCMRAAEGLLSALEGLDCRDRDIQLRLSGLQNALARHVRDEAPWKARTALDTLVMLDTTSWAGLLGFIDEFPVLHAAAGESRKSLRSIKPGDFEFISENDQVGLVTDFVRCLPDSLTR